MIVANASNSNYESQQVMQGWQEKQETSSLRFHLLTEANNCAFLTRRVSNVIIRWDRYFDDRVFRLQNENGRGIKLKYGKDETKPTWSQIVI